MKVYWLVNTKNIIDRDKYNNPIYEREELHGEIVGAYSQDNGSNGDRLVIALPNGVFTTHPISDCYHKEMI